MPGGQQTSASCTGGKSHLPKRVTAPNQCKWQRLEKGTFFLVRRCGSALMGGFSRSCQQLRPAPEPDPDRRSGTSRCCAAVFCCCTRPVNCGLRISDLLFDLGGAKGIRTPDLLHAISRQHVHRRPSMQVTVPGRAHESSGIWAGCGTFLLYRAEPAPLLTPADTRPVESLRIYRAGYQEPRTPSASQGQQVQL